MPSAISQTFIQMPSGIDDDNLYCDSWRLSVETNNAGYWKTAIPRCSSYVQDYINGTKYLSDSMVVAMDSIDFAKTINITSDGNDAWVFDIDETLISNKAHFQRHGYESKRANDFSFKEWVESAQAPALPASLELYNYLKIRGFTIFLLTGRPESQRNATVSNLLSAGYSGWCRLILRGKGEDDPAIVFKAGKRAELGKEGYKIHGNSGDQWSDLLGYPAAERSFKVPNPMYFVP
ncbi:hypothetical protein K2173_016215 [Erythroxylum novogranatense]|uniref:Acid phosphatase 1 n=1 Tax=Erythroxylum novogranatense TaxID=1862640 RepID=A0AAV8SG88_9ROSI|nr:hypothetical protein K2173_016215 [Erythroxylum novogranatense]